jgi:purine nucleosidase
MVSKGKGPMADEKRGWFLKGTGFSPYISLLERLRLQPLRDRLQVSHNRVPHISLLRCGIPQPLAALVLLIASLIPLQSRAQAVPQKQLVILDTDIGDDIDDAFALALVERSPELQVLGITTAYGDTNLRAQLALRFLGATGFGNIPVAAGVPTSPKARFTQAEYAEAGDKSKIQQSNGPDFLLDQIRKHPGQITLIVIGPQTNVAAAIDKDPTTFRKLKRIVMMGGSVDRGYGHPYPDAEWNILCDIPAARKVFAAGVPIYMMPLDSTLLRFDPARLAQFFNTHTALSQQLQILYSEWSGPASKPKMPTLFDPMAVTYAIKPDLCPTTPMHLTVDDKGFTRRSPGTPNVNACLQSNPEAFFDFYLSRTAAK